MGVLSDEIEKVATDTSYTNPNRKFIMPPDDGINPHPLVNPSTTAIYTIYTGCSTSDMRMGGGIIPQYTHNIPSEEVI